MVMAFTFGRMVVNTKEVGKMGSNTVLANTSSRMEVFAKASGKKANGKNGLIKMRCHLQSHQSERVIICRYPTTIKRQTMI